MKLRKETRGRKARAKTTRRELALAPGRRRAPRTSHPPYQLPPLDLLEDRTPIPNAIVQAGIDGQTWTIECLLRDAGLPAHIASVASGPSITTFALTVEPNTDCGRILGLQDDLASALGVPVVRICVPMPGVSAIGIEVPTRCPETIGLKSLIRHREAPGHGPSLPLYIGKDVSGRPLIRDLRKMQHLLVAATDDHDVSMCLDTILHSVLLTRTPDECGMLLLLRDEVHAARYQRLPHLLAPVVTDPQCWPKVLEWLAGQAKRRRETSARAKGRRGIGRSSALPRIVVVVDDLADIMRTAAGTDVEVAIARLARIPAAGGVHLVLATRHPEPDVVTGLIRSNFPTRVALKVQLSRHSRCILDQHGAERLLGNGDMLLSEPGSPELLHGQVATISSRESRCVMDFLHAQGALEADPALARVIQATDRGSTGSAQPSITVERRVLDAQREFIELLDRTLLDARAIRDRLANPDP